MILREQALSLFYDDSGQSLVETGLIYMLIAIAVLFSLARFGDELLVLYTNSAKRIDEIVK
jgi:Flp pilus assembly pilin Flp